MNSTCEWRYFFHGRFEQIWQMSVVYSCLYEWLLQTSFRVRLSFNTAVWNTIRPQVKLSKGTNVSWLTQTQTASLMPDWVMICCVQNGLDHCSVQWKSLIFSHACGIAVVGDIWQDFIINLTVNRETPQRLSQTHTCMKKYTRMNESEEGRPLHY